MSKKSRHNAERRNRLAALRAEVTLTLEDKAKPHHMTYNARQTAQLISDFNRTGLVPIWADMEIWADKDYVNFSHTNDPTKWETDYVDAVSYAMVHGQSITKMVKPST
jgi:hypothetical protein